MGKIFLFALLMLLFLGCSNNKQNAIEEIEKTEKDFEKMVAEKGLAEAFGFYAAPKGVKSLGDSLIFGNEAIRNFYLAQDHRKIELTWNTDFADASKSGDLAYTYGKYSIKMINAKGDEVVSTGIFHTVWQKQANGDWKFVWD
jgi:ketosteroid isomerase-like protein